MEQTQHRQYFYPFFGFLPLSTRLLYTMVLLTMGTGYVLGLVQIYTVHSGYDGRVGLSVEDIQIAYAGKAHASRLETALRGPMAGMLPVADAAKIIDWIGGGADQLGYDAVVKPIVTMRCLMCHDGSNSGLPRLTSYDEIKQLTGEDHGISISSLVRVSHIHLFGLTFVFAITGFIFNHAYVRWRYFKSIVICVPFMAIFLDIASWWLTKVALIFAYTVVTGGALMALSFAIQWLVSIYQMWFMREPPAGWVSQ